MILDTFSNTSRVLIAFADPNRSSEQEKEPLYHGMYRPPNARFFNQGS